MSKVKELEQEIKYLKREILTQDNKINDLNSELKHIKDMTNLYDSSCSFKFDENTISIDRVFRSDIECTAIDYIKNCSIHTSIFYCSRERHEELVKEFNKVVKKQV